MVKGGKDNRSFRNIRRTKKKFAGNRHTVLSHAVKNVVKEVLENVLDGVVNEFISSIPVFSSPVANSSPTISYKSESGITGVETDDKCMKGSESICKDYQIYEYFI